MLNDSENEKYDGYIKFDILKEFFVSEFGVDEYEVFLEAANKFNDEARKLIGLATVEMPTDKIVDTFRRGREEKIKDKDYYISLLPEGITGTQRDIICRNFIDKERYKLLLAVSDKCSFADSFISSEWYYNQNIPTGALEQTAIVVGYLKSVEQLLYTMIRYWINDNKWIKINGKYEDSFKGNKTYHGNGLIDFIEANEKYVDKTLGALIRFIKLKKDNEFKNISMFCVDKTTLQCIIDVLYNFKDLERNDRLHQHNLYTEEAVEEIREQAWLLYFLLLGSFDVSDKYINELAVGSAMDESFVIDEEILYQKIRKWATPTIKYDLPSKTDIIAFRVIHLKGTPWELGIEVRKPKNTYSSFCTRNVLEWTSEEPYDLGMQKLERLLTRYIREEASVGSRLANCDEVVLDSLQVDKILYKKV